jgi:hypothetical protein
LRGVERRNLRRSRLIYERIRSGEEGWLDDLM